LAFKWADTHLILPYCWLLEGTFPVKNPHTHAIVVICLATHSQRPFFTHSMCMRILAWACIRMLASDSMCAWDFLLGLDEKGFFHSYVDCVPVSSQNWCCKWTIMFATLSHILKQRWILVVCVFIHSLVQFSDGATDVKLLAHITQNLVYYVLSCTVFFVYHWTILQVTWFCLWEGECLS
jgi:hypothetical protein